jgi:hypothetical protein
MNRTTILCVLLVFIGFSMARAQNPFKGNGGIIRPFQWFVF